MGVTAIGEKRGEVGEEVVAGMESFDEPLVELLVPGNGGSEVLSSQMDCESSEDVGIVLITK